MSKGAAVTQFDLVFRARRLLSRVENGVGA